MMITPKMIVDRKRLDAWAGRSDVRLGVAIVLVIFHLAAFTRAAHVRLHLPFNVAPGETPYYSNPDIGSLQGYPRQPHRWSRLVVSRWDAQHYIGFAVRGVTSCPKDPKTARDGDYMSCGLVWMPSYGLIAGTISDLTHAPPDYVLLAMSILAALAINFLWTSTTITSRMGRLEAYLALLAFNLFPSAFFVVTPYAEAASFAFALGGFICLANNRWILGGALIGASTGLRTAAAGFAVGFGIAALYEIWKRRQAKDKQWWRPLVGAALAGWGQIATMLYLYVTLHEPLANLRAQHAFGANNKEGLQFLRLLNPKFYVQGMSVQHMDGVIVVASIALIALGAREALKRFKRTEAIYLAAATAAIMIIPLAAKSYYYWGLNRYMLLAPLTFVCAGVIGRKHRAFYVGWLLLSFAFYWHVEMCSYISQGDRNVCPCLGRTEFTMPYGS